MCVSHESLLENNLKALNLFRGSQTGVRKYAKMVLEKDGEPVLSFALDLAPIYEC